MRAVAARFSVGVLRSVGRVVPFEHLAAEWEPGLNLLALASSPDECSKVEAMQAAGLPVAWVRSEALSAGDVISCDPEAARALVLFRESDTHHALLTTNRCNSYCLMCSQPPTRQNDEWRIQEALDVVDHIRKSPTAIGLTGGEPLLLGEGLRHLVSAIADRHPATHIEILSNGRLLGDPAVEHSIFPLRGKTAWLVPLYGHADFLHDFVVQSPGAFDETIAGLLTLQSHQQAIQLRVVLIEPVLRVLPELCRFIGRNLPFVSQVALMACEPVGFALANREHCEVDLSAWAGTLVEATDALHHHQVPFLFMNTPLCAIPKELWRHAHKSISDWKNVYPSECSQCSLKNNCCGLFAWHQSGWKPARIKPITEEATA